MKSTLITFLVLSTLTFNVVSAQNHFQPIWSFPYLPMNIYVTQADLSGGGSLGAGDEIGIFDGENCVGAALLTGPIDPLEPLAMVASTDDPVTPEIDGFVNGNSISYKFWLSATSTEVVNVEAQYGIGDGTFASQGTAVVSLVGEIPVKVDEQNGSNTSFQLDHNYPNPFNPETTIRYSIPKPRNVSLVIYSLDGKLIKSLADGYKGRGYYEVVWDGTNEIGNTISSGIYFYVMQAGQFSSIKKMIFLK